MAAGILDLVELIVWLLPDIASIGNAARTASDDQRTFDQRLTNFAAATPASRQDTLALGDSRSGRSTTG
jgi:hypothetical protein